MRAQVRVRFDSKNIPGGAQAILEPAGCGPDVATVEDVPVLRQVVVWVTLDVTDPRFAMLLELLKPYDKDPLTRYHDIFTEEELNSARLLVMAPNEQNPELCAGVEYGMTYDFSGACPACCTGGRQTSALFVDGDDLPNISGYRAVQTNFYHLLVDEGIEEALLQSAATGISFRSVYALMRDQRQVKLRYRQLCAERTLPPMSPRTTGLVRNRVCEVCRRNGHFTNTQEEPYRFVYRASDLRDVDDIHTTWENIGYAIPKPDLRESLLSYPWTLVTPKIRRVFLDAGATNFTWIPVRVEDDTQGP